MSVFYILSDSSLDWLILSEMLRCISTESYKQFYVQLFLTEKLVSPDIMKNKEEILELIKKELSRFFGVRTIFISNWKCKVIFCWFRERIKCYSWPHSQVKHKMLSLKPSQAKRNYRLLEGIRSPNLDYGSWWELNFFPLPRSKTFTFPFVSFYIQLSLRIQLFLLAPRHSGRLTKREVCDSATGIPVLMT